MKSFTKAKCQMSHLSLLSHQRTELANRLARAEKATKKPPERFKKAIVSSFLVLTFMSGQTAYSKPTMSLPEAQGTSQATEPDAAQGTSQATEPDAAQSTKEDTKDEKVEPQKGAVSKNQAPQEDREALQNDRIGKATDHFQIAHKYMNRGDFTLAEVEMQEAIANAPQVKAFHRDYCLIALAKFQPALATAEFMLATGLGDPIPYSEQEKKDLDKNAATLHYNKGINYGRKSRWIQAVAELQKALEYNPNNTNIKRSLAFALGSEGRFDLAEKTYEQTFGQMPDDAFAHADFAFLLSEHGQKQSAFDQLAKAVELQPQSAALRVDLAWLSENKGDYKKASQEIKEAIKLSPGHAALWSHLGRILEHEGDVPEAKAAYTKAVALDPDQDQARESLKKLAGK